VGFLGPSRSLSGKLARLLHLDLGYGPPAGYVDADWKDTSR